MKIYLDLLPGDRKEEIEKKRIFWKIFRQEILFFMPISFFIAILITTNITLKIQLDSLEKTGSLEQSQEKYQELKNYEGKFRQINLQVNSLSNFQKNHLHWFNAISEVSNTVPDGIYISGLTTKDFNISLSGKAKTRDDLLALQDKLNANKCFKNLNVPLSNLVNKDDVDFQIDFEVQKDCLSDK
jgi:Tfp pilus assembly protein PilN